MLDGPDPKLQDQPSNDWLRDALREPAFSPKSWFSLCELCVSNGDPYKLIFTLSALAYVSDDNASLTETLLAFATVPAFRDIPLPQHHFYSLSNGYAPTRETLQQIIASCAEPFENSDAAQLSRFNGENDRDWTNRQSNAFEAALAAQISRTVDSVIQQWPRLKPLHAESLLFLPDVECQIQALFDSWDQNRQLKKYVNDVQGVLNRFHEAKSIELPDYRFLPCFDHLSRPKLSVSLFVDRAAPLIPPPPLVFVGPSDVPVSNISQTKSSALQGLVSEFSKHPTDIFLQRYGHDLMQSFQAFGDQNNSSRQSPCPYSIHDLGESLRCWGVYAEQIQAVIRSALGPCPGSHDEHVMVNTGLWPRLTSRSLLGSLSTQSTTVLSQPWKTVMTSLGKALVHLHRARRLFAFALRKELSEFFKELGNIGFQNWDVESYPDWLLIQVRLLLFTLHPV